MPLFVALITGTGEGCDYTFACNRKWEIGEADNISDFRMRVLGKHHMLDFESDWIPDILIEKMEIFEIAGESQEVTGIPEWFFEKRKEVEKIEIENKKKRMEEDERLLYQKLKKKYDSK